MRGFSLQLKMDLLGMKYWSWCRVISPQEGKPATLKTLQSFS